jgi:hypothetical protein
VPSPSIQLSFDQAQSAAQRALATALSCAEQLERGHAEMPLGDNFRAIGRDLADETWSLCAVVEKRTFTPFATWLCGGDRNHVTAVDASVGVVELAFHGERFVLDTRDGAMVFDSLSDLLHAAAPSSVSTANAALKMSAPAAGRIPSAKVQIILGTDQFVLDPNLVSTLLARTNGLWLVGECDWKWDAPTQNALRSLCSGMDVVCPIVVACSDTPRPANGWWTDPLVSASRQRPVWLDHGDPVGVPPVLSAENDPLRRALQLSRIQARVQQGLETLKERIDFSRQQARARRAKEERMEKSLGEGAADTLIRSPLEIARTRLADDIAALQRGLQETSRRSLGREGNLTAKVNGLVQSVGSNDLSQTVNRRTITLTLDDSFTTRFAKDLRHAFHEELRGNLITLRDGLQVAARSAQHRLQQLMNVSMPLDLQVPDEQPIREALRDFLNLELKYRGELPKRGFMQRLGEGRRMIFATMMTVTLFGGLMTGSTNVRGLIAPFGFLFILLFVAVVLWTYRTWSREDGDRIGQEIGKIREQLQTEAMRLVRDAERERLARLSEALETVKKDALRRIEEFGRQITLQISANQAREKGAIRDRLRVIDQQVKELDALRSSIQRADQDAIECSRQVSALLSLALREPQAA